VTAEPTQEQRSIIDLDGGCFLVEAPPGSGKTYVLTERVRRLLNQSPSENYRILALTFTTKAAETLSGRIADSEIATAARVNADTFHGFALSVLSAHGSRVAFPSSPTILERPSDRRDALARALAEEGLEPGSKKELDKVLNAIGAEKRALRLDSDVADAELARSYRVYQRVLSESAACDFDDLLLLVWRLFNEHPRVAAHYRTMYRYILVDEAQDTSRVQYEILKALCGAHHRSVLLVADKSQGIYGFAGASTEFLDAFVKDFGATRIPLTQNFRSAAAIVNLANELVSHDDRLRKPSIEAVGAQGHVGASVRDTEKEEAGLVVRGIKHLLSAGLRREWVGAEERTTLLPEEIAVLGRGRSCLKGVLTDLHSAGVEHLFASGEEGLFETPLVRLFVGGLRLIANPQDRVTLDSLSKQWALGSSEGLVSLLDAVASKATSAQPVVNLLRRMMAAKRPVDVNPFVLEAISILKAAGTAPTPAGGVAASGERNLVAAEAATLEERWVQYRGPLAPLQRTVGGFLGTLALSGRSVLRGPGVRVMTIHAAKGLEFRAVFLVGLNEGTLPDYRALDEQGIREERRAAYVAITRAARLLIITRAATRVTPWGDVELVKESRFIEEMKLTMARAGAASHG
jgi:DNA helicase-2/ATP-dependent DNA helicase PcrA